MPAFATEQLRKIFVGGLNLETTEEGMKDYFSRWGECVDVVVMRYGDSRRSRGFGFVTFESIDSVDAVLDAKPHVLDGKDIEPKRAVAREETVRSSIAETEKSKKVFVGGLASSTTEEDVKQCFTKFCQEVGRGKVEEVMLMKDKENHNRLRGFCFVIFDSDEIVDKVCSVKYFEIKTKTVEVRRAESRQVMRRKEERETAYKRRHEDSFSRRDMDSPRGGNNMGGNAFGSGGLNPVAMQAALTGGGGMPFFGGAFGGSRGGPGGFSGGFGMNPYGFGGMMGGFTPGMLNMLASSMGMNAMGGGMGGMGGGGFAAGGMGGGGEQGFRKDRGDGMRGSTGLKPGGYSGDSLNAGKTSSVDGGGYGGQNSSGYDQSGGMVNPMGDMSGYAGQMGGMWGSGGATPANVQAAMLAGYSGVGMDNASDYSELGAYNQTSSFYGPSRGTPAGKSTGGDAGRRGFKPY